MANPSHPTPQMQLMSEKKTILCNNAPIRTFHELQPPIGKIRICYRTEWISWLPLDPNANWMPSLALILSFTFLGSIDTRWLAAGFTKQTSRAREMLDGEAEGGGVRGIRVFDVWWRGPLSPLVFQPLHISLMKCSPSERLRVEGGEACGGGEQV